MQWNATQLNAMQCMYVYLYFCTWYFYIAKSCTLCTTYDKFCVRVCMLYARKTIVKHINGIGCANEFKSQTQAHVHATRTYTHTHTHTHLSSRIMMWSVSVVQRQQHLV